MADCLSRTLFPPSSLLPPLSSLSSPPPLPPSLQFKIIRTAYEPLPPGVFSRPFQQLVNTMLRADPGDRPSTKALLQVSEGVCEHLHTHTHTRTHTHTHIHTHTLALPLPRPQLPFVRKHMQQLLGVSIAPGASLGHAELAHAIRCLRRGLSVAASGNNGGGAAAASAAAAGNNNNVNVAASVDVTRRKGGALAAGGQQLSRKAVRTPRVSAEGVELRPETPR